MLDKRKIIVGSLVALVVVVFLVLLYLSMGNSSSKGDVKSPFNSNNGDCGGNDALCRCCGNEEMVSQRVTDDRLSATLQGVL